VFVNLLSGGTAMSTWAQRTRVIFGALASCLTRSRCWHGVVSVVFLTVGQTGWCQPVTPEFALVGRSGHSGGKLWSETLPNPLFPRQIVLDVNESGTFYGFACEYRWEEGVWSQLRETMERRPGMQRKATGGTFWAWRDEGNKLAICMFRDAEAEAIKLIVVSTDSSLRGQSSKGSGTISPGHEGGTEESPRRAPGAETMREAPLGQGSPDSEEPNSLSTGNAAVERQGGR